MNLKEFGRELGRLTLFGTLVGYGYTFVYYVGHLVFGGTAIHTASLGNTPHSGLLYVIGAATILPLIAALASLITAALTTLITGQLKVLTDKRRELIGLISVVFVTTAVLGLPRKLTNLMYGQTLVAYLLGITLGAGLVFAAVKWPTVERWARRIAGCVLAAAVILFTVFYLWGLPDFEYPLPADEPVGVNVLVIISDAHRADVAGVNGGEVPTPNLERLAALGVNFTNCHSASNWTLPSVTSIFTGMEPAVHQVDTLGNLGGLPTLQGQLRARGYRTWALYVNSAFTVLTGHYRGFDTYVNYCHKLLRTLGSITDFYGPLYFTIADWLTELLAAADFQHLKTLPVELAVDLAVRLPPAGGVFAYVHLYDPHAPPERYRAETPYEGPYEVWSGFLYPTKARQRGLDRIPQAERRHMFELYKGEIRYEDEMLGRILDSLEETGALENTAVIFTADHGEEFWEHGGIGHYRQLYEESTHVPLLVYWPGVLEGGLTRDDPVSITDIYPTVLELTGTDYERGAVFARSLTLPPEPDRPIFSERYKGRDTAHELIQIAVRTPRGTLILHRVTGETELYLPGDYEMKRETGVYYPELRDELLELIFEYDEQNEHLRETYNPRPYELSDEEAESQLEGLRAIGYIQ